MRQPLPRGERRRRQAHDKLQAVNGQNSLLTA
nr:MAG TPA: hypothetical protein [Inoviridae sp.]DAO95699.1 MAG TPA: hypothetical protein [Inoviridae sp.]DAY10869.1 MAG TPA: hypothetical protein [Inoviridae sp.]